jgi:chorismate-pyruvate lyase
MTSKLEKHHSSGINLEILQCGHGEEGHYYREVMLRSAQTGEAVEYGAIEIFLETLPPHVQAEITAGRIPLGGLLNTHRIDYHSRPQAFFCVHKEPALCELLRVPLESELYGRCNILCTEDSVLMARILEVLPPASESKNVS